MGDPNAVAERLALIEEIEFLEVSEASRQLAANLTDSGAIPPTEP